MSKPSATDNRLRWRLMHRDALQRLADADTLAHCAGNAQSSSAYLLTLLGFELLLKLAYETTTGKRASKGHHYAGIFRGMSLGARRRLLRAARTGIGPSALNRRHLKVLTELGNNFVALRYPFDRYDGMTEAQYTARGRRWSARGGPLRSADFRFHPEELFALTTALKTMADQLAENGYIATERIDA